MGTHLEGAAKQKMNLDNDATFAGAALPELKDFQRRTAEYAFERLFKAQGSTRRFLIADEVGLGKTLVAAGVIGLAIDHLRSIGTPRIDIIYICSNQAIARQNVNRIKRLLGIEARPLASRITLLPYRLDTLQNPVNLVALTPGTSFGSASAEGVVEERIILYRMLREVWGDGVGHHRLVFLGGLKSVESFRYWEWRIHSRPIDPGIVRRFGEMVGGAGSELHEELLRLGGELAERPRREARRHRRRFVANLRRILAMACLDSLEPDMVVQDEFQRFRHLLDADTESGELAQRLFEYEDEHTDVRTMLLSATPYKMYTMSHELDDNHYEDFVSTVKLLQGPEGSVNKLEDALGQFRAELPQIAGEGESGKAAAERLSSHRDLIQAELRRVMSRTERNGGESLGDPMLAVRELPVGLEADDVESYLSAREISAVTSAPGIVEYWKSTPYLLSFMDQYRLAERVRSAVAGDPKGEVADLIQSGAGLKLPRQATAQREEINGGNGRMRALLADLRESGLQGLLWLPPVLSGHKLSDEFECARDATKRLLFSSWTMVPRAISVLASYDAERRYLPEMDRAEQYSPNALPVTRTGYALFSFLLPTSVLAEAGDPYQYPPSDTTGLLRAIGERLRPRVEQITRDAPPFGQPQNIWYAIAPLLLNGDSPDSIWWLRDTGGANQEGDVDDAENSIWRDLVAAVRSGLADPSSLGRPPDDLVEMLAALSLSSPANASLRALSRITLLPTADRGLRRESLTAAWAFRSFFRSPACEGLLREVYRPSLPLNTRTHLQRALAGSVKP